jgi:hypothetical protein
MSAFQINDKVVCIDASQTPAKCGKRESISSFVLPGGFVEEGSVYCVEYTRLRPDGRTALSLVGKPIIVGGKDVLWNGQRFRKLQRKKMKSNQLPIQELRIFTPNCIQEPLQRSMLLQYPNMSIFRPNDKIVCIDDTPIPVYLSPGVSAAVSDFTFPYGGIKDGRIYCVLDCRSRTVGGDAVFLVGKPAYLDGEEVSWSSFRFRKIDQASYRRQKISKEKKTRQNRR